MKGTVERSGLLVVQPTTLNLIDAIEEGRLGRERGERFQFRIGGVESWDDVHVLWCEVRKLYQGVVDLWADGTAKIATARVL